MDKEHKMGKSIYVIETITFLGNFCKNNFYCKYHVKKRGFCLYQLWKFHDFSITQILRENDFENSRSAKSAILIQL